MAVSMRSLALCVLLGLSVVPAAALARTAPAPAAASAVAATPGRLIEARPLAAEYGLDAAARALAIRYGSIDGVTGQGVVEVTGALFLPKGTPPTGGWPLVAWEHGTVGIGDDCAPSRNVRSLRDRTYLNHWLDEGYAVVATDYQGLGAPGPHPYLNSRAAAYSTLDAIRAVQGGDFGLAKQVLIVGQSQGAGAAFATAGYTPDYAPDVDIRGTIATGIPNLGAAATTQTDPAEAEKVDRIIAYLLYIASAANQIDPAYDPSAILTDRAMPAFEKAADSCVVDMFNTVVDAGLTRRNTFKGDFWRYYAPVLKHAGYPTLKIAAPVFIGTGMEDVDTPAAMQTALVASSCAAGSKIEAHIYPGLDHSATLNRSFADSRIFARRAIDGEPIKGNCPAQPAQ
ncbi:lipase family protein [Sphingopyxis terrae]|uniref:lipase family protein n=1 Tax=Sphingopyxis terrae TaxID=33052 RepID=UPI002A148A9A|nr:lipase family protein [Sphingopyxis terrae]MDX8357728.1 lipase family protein [Sphingopyxis terrae]